MESHPQKQINKLSVFLLKNYSHEFGRNKDPRGESAVDLAIRILTPTIPPKEGGMNKEKPRELVPAFADRLAPIYQQLGWHWDIGEQAHIPDSIEIAVCLYDLLDRIEDGGNISIGGLTVSHDKEQNVVSLGFTKSVEVCLNE